MWLSSPNSSFVWLTWLKVSVCFFHVLILFCNACGSLSLVGSVCMTGYIYIGPLQMIDEHCRHCICQGCVNINLWGWGGCNTPSSDPFSILSYLSNRNMAAVTLLPINPHALARTHTCHFIDTAISQHWYPDECNEASQGSLKHTHSLTALWAHNKKAHEAKTHADAHKVMCMRWQSTCFLQSDSMNKQVAVHTHKSSSKQ